MRKNTLQKHNWKIILLLVVVCSVISIASWEFLFSQNDPSDGIVFRAVAFADAKTVIAVGDSGTVARSTDQGGTWSISHNINRLTTPLNGICFTDPTHGFVVGANGTLLMTTNG